MPIGERTNNSNKKNDNNGFLSFIPHIPKYTFDDLILPENLKEEIFDVTSFVENKNLVFDDWGLKNTHKYQNKMAINLYGPPGTGKTLTAHAIADHLNKKIIEVNYAEIESKYVGETPKNLTTLFNSAEEDCIIFFDEADAILSKRVSNMSHATDTSVNQTRSVMLMLLNDYDGFIIFATNFIENFDPAFMRRIFAHIYFGLPDQKTRKKLWNHFIPESLPNNLDVNEISKKYDKISGSDISTAVLRAAFKAARRNNVIVKGDYFKSSIKSIINSKKTNKKTKIKDRIVTEEYAKKQIGINNLKTED